MTSSLCLHRYLFRLSDEVIQSNLRTATLNLSVIHQATRDQRMVLSAALDVQSTAAKQVVQLRIVVDMPHNSPQSVQGCLWRS